MGIEVPSLSLSAGIGVLMLAIVAKLRRGLAKSTLAKWFPRRSKRLEVDVNNEASLY